MDPVASEADAAAADSGLKKQPKVRKAAKDLMPDEQKKESEQHRPSSSHAEPPERGPT
jgi:hypothetical protein